MSCGARLLLTLWGQDQWPGDQGAGMGDLAESQGGQARGGEGLVLRGGGGDSRASRRGDPLELCPALQGPHLPQHPEPDTKKSGWRWGLSCRPGHPKTPASPQEEEARAGDVLTVVSPCLPGHSCAGQSTMASDHQTQAGKPQPLNPKVGARSGGGAGHPPPSPPPSPPTPRPFPAQGMQALMQLCRLTPPLLGWCASYFAPRLGWTSAHQRSGSWLRGEGWLPAPRLLCDPGQLLDFSESQFPLKWEEQPGSA